MIKVFLAAILFIGIAVLGMSASVLLKKNGRFPETDLGKNENMKKLGIRCAKDIDEEIHSGGKFSCGSMKDDSCAGCGFFGA